MTKARIYDDPCGIARALDRVGERWALLVVRELVLGPKRFTDLKEALSGASPNVLSQRLAELTASGVVERRQLERPSQTWVYELTPWGKELEAVIFALARWGSRATPVPVGELSADALVLALHTTYAPRASDVPLTVELVLDGDRYGVHLGDTLSARRSAAPDAAAVVDTDAGTLRRVVFGDLSVDDARARSLLRVSGSERAASRFLRSFRRPQPRGTSPSS